MASIQKFKPIGYRVRWKLYLPDGTNKEKFKASRSKYDLQEILPDIMRIESLTRRCEVKGEDLLKALHMGIITREEVGLFSHMLGGNPIPHYLEELRKDFEIQSKTRSAGLHCHSVNLSRAKLLERYFGDTPIQKIDHEAIERFRNYRKQTVSNTTVNHDLKILRRYFDIATNKGWIKNNLARNISLLQEPKNRIPRCLYPEELKLFLAGLRQHSHLLRGEIIFIVKFLLLTGLRRSELCGLKPENIKLHLRQIHLIGKGKKARIVGIHQSLVDDLKERTEKGYILFPGIDSSSISHAFKKIVRSVGLPEVITLHSLRHTYISYLLEKGVDPVTVRERAGHFSLSITDHYAHALPSEMVAEDVIEVEQLTHVIT